MKPVCSETIRVSRLNLCLTPVLYSRIMYMCLRPANSMLMHRLEITSYIVHVNTKS